MNKKHTYFLSIISLMAVTPTVFAGLLYTIDDGVNRLLSIDTDTFLTTDIGSIGFSVYQTGLAYDSRSGTLYMVDGISDNLYIVDKSTGSASLIGSSGISSRLTGLAYDSLNDILYSTSYNSDGTGALYTLSTNTGIANIVGPTYQITGLTYDSFRDRLIGTTDNTSIYEIDRMTADPGGAISGYGVPSKGFSYDADKDIYWNTGREEILYSYDNFFTTSNEYILQAPNTGYVGALRLSGLAYASTVPVPAATWLFGSGLLGLIGVARRKA